MLRAARRLETLRPVRAGEELTYDYGIELSVRHTARMKRVWACRCGAGHCSGTMLKNKRKAAAPGASRCA